MKKYYIIAFFVFALVSFLSFGAIAAGGGGIISTLSSTPPTVNITHPFNSSQFSYFISNFSWSITPWVPLTSCWYIINGGNDTFVNCYDNFSSISTLSDGIYHLQFVVNQSLFNIWSDESYFTIDTVPPAFSGDAESPADPAAYSPGQFYEFSIDLDGSESSVWYEFEGVNYTSVYNSGSTYYFNRTDFGAGTYLYRWFANDSLGNENQTGLYSYTVNPADPSPGMNITGNDTITYGEYTDFIGVDSNIGDGGCNYSLNPPISTLFGAGTVTFNFSTGGCANYSAGSVTRNLIINQAAPVLTFLANSGTANLTLIYGNNLNVSATSSISGLNVGLDRNGASVSGENGLDVILAGSATYTYRANITGNQNYSDVGYRYISIDVTPANSTTSLSVNPTSPVSYGTLSNFSCSNSAGLGMNLYLNGGDISSEMGVFGALRGVGTYYVNCTSAGNENYTGSSISANYIIDKATPVLSLIFSPGSLVSAGTETNVTGSGCLGQFSCLLYRNGIEVNNSDIATLGGGTYSYEFNTSGNANYTNASVFGSLTVKASSGGGGSSSSRAGACSSNWTCSAWSACTGGLQSRTCALISPFCRAAEDSPVRTQSCQSPGGLNNSIVNSSEEVIAPSAEPVSGQSGRAGITGAVIGALSGGSGLLIIIFVIGLVVAYRFTVARKKNFQSSLEKTIIQAK